MLTSTDRALIADRRRKVAANIQAGLSQAQIADALGVSRPTVHRDVQALIREWKAGGGRTIETYVALENSPLDRMLNVIWPDVLNGNLQAIDKMLRIMERRAKLLGLDAPTRVDARYANMDDQELEAFIRGEIASGAPPSNLDASEQNI